jgi:hypothetical protein
VRLDRFGIFTISILPNDAVNRHTTPHDIEAGFAPFNVILSHDHTRFQFTGSWPENECHCGGVGGVPGFEGDTSRPQVWEKLTGLLNDTFETASGLELGDHV